MALKIGCTAGLIALLCIALSSYFLSETHNDSEIVRIDTPELYQIVGAVTSVAGTARGLPPNSKIGVAALSLDGKVYYVHYDHTYMQDHGRWCSSHVLVGNKEDDDKDYRIVAFTAPESAMRELRDYLRNPRREPLKQLPREAEIQEEVPVTRARGNEAVAQSPPCPPEYRGKDWLEISAEMAGVISGIAVIWAAIRGLRACRWAKEFLRSNPTAKQKNRKQHAVKHSKEKVETLRLGE